MSTVQFIIQLLALLACLPHCSLGEKPAALVASGEGSLYPDLPDPEHTATEEEINSRSPGAPSYFEGDIVLTEDQRQVIERQSRGQVSRHDPQRAITRRESRRWEGGKVPYVISSSLSSRARRAIEAAVSEYVRHTCIQLYPRSSEKDYIFFHKGSGCSSSVGRVGGGQRISIGSGCEYTGIVIHEIFHALGRWHEQSRPDRDQFIDIKYENMKDGVEPNFIKLTTNQVKTQGVSYDYGSIMHYSAYAFSRNGRPTIESRNQRVSSGVMGQRERLSNKDIQHANALYCTADPASWSSWGAWSSCSRTCNGGSRYRSRSCEGGTSCSGSSSQQETCNPQPCQEVAAVWSDWGKWSGCSATCGGGRQGRTRQCVNGNTCSGPSAQYRDCNTQSCPEVWSPWSSWTACSLSCGGGVQRRSRECVSQICSGPSAQQRNCNTERCPSEPSLVEHEGCYQVLPNRGLFLLEGKTSSLTDNPFQRAEPVEKCAEAAIQFSYSIIGVAAGYCVSGNHRISDFTEVPSNQCRDGRGAYQRGTFYMDVYTVTDPVARDEQSSEVQSQQPAPTSSGDIIRNQTLLTFLIIAIITITLV